jgi:hypothetical protein
MMILELEFLASSTARYVAYSPMLVDAAERKYRLLDGRP